MKKLFSLMALFVVSLLMVSMVSAASESVSTLGNLNSTSITVEINGDEYETGSLLTFDEGDHLDIEVRLDNVDNGDNLADDAEGIEVLARISGYEYSDYESLEDTTHVFNVREGTKKTVDLSLDVPYNLENGENTLRIYVLDRNSEEIKFYFPLYVESARHSIDITDVSLSPGTTVQAGRSLLASVLLENQGEKDEEDIKVTVSLPELGVSATEYVDNVDSGDTEDVPEMFLPIPSTVAAGEYTIKVTAQYDNLRETVTKVGKVTVLGNAAMGPAMDSDKLVLAVGPESQNVAAGATATYGIALTNAGKTSKAYTLEATTGDWATATVSDALVVLSPGQNKVVYVKVAANADATAGEHLASVVVKSGSEVLETVPLKATVTAQEAKSGADFSLRNGLEIALIVLVVLLVVIGLIVGFSRLRKDEEEEEQTYY